MDQSKINRMITEKIFDQVWNEAYFDQVEDLISDDTKFHFRKQTALINLEDLKRIITAWHRAFPDFRIKVEDLISKDDRVAVRLMMSGTQQGEWKDIPPSGRHFSVTAMMFLRFENGRLEEIWEDFDEYSMRQQLGS